MATNNAVNLKSSGVVGYDAAGAFTGNAVTNHAVLVGGATSSSITSISVGGANTALLGNAGADPSFGAVPNATLQNSSVTINTSGGLTGGGTVALGASLSLSGNGAAVPNLVYIGSSTASNSAQLDFTSLSSTYRGYRFYISTLLPASSTRLQLALSTDNGSTFISTSTYRSTCRTLTGTTWATLNPSMNTIFFFQTSNSTSAVSGYIDVLFNNGANNLVTVYGDLGEDANGMTVQMSGNNTSQLNVNAVRFKEGTGNITSGTIYQFGIQ